MEGTLCVTDQYWDEKGPIFFYTGNEGPITGFWENSGFVFEAAQKFNALVIFGEHVSTQGCFGGVYFCVVCPFGICTSVVVLCNL